MQAAVAGAIVSFCVAGLSLVESEGVWIEPLVLLVHCRVRVCRGQCDWGIFFLNILRCCRVVWVGLSNRSVLLGHRVQSAGPTIKL